MPLSDAERTALARKLFPLLPHPERPDEPWWTPGRVCDNWVRCFAQNPPVKYRRGPAGTEIDHDPHEMPPPNPMDDTVFRQLLMATKCVIGWNGHSWYAARIIPSFADDPRDALLLAVAALKGVK